MILTVGDPVEECRGDEFACKDGSGCIPTDKECDKKFDCKDKSDEDKSYCKSILYTNDNMVVSN